MFVRTIPQDSSKGRYSDTTQLLWGRIALAAVAALLFFTLFGFGCNAGYKSYSRYQLVADAKNDLKRAQYNKKIQVEDAEGQRLAAIKLADVERERAKGVRDANATIAKTLTGEYLRYFYISQLSKVENAGGRIIYVPTEAGLPILEAGRAPSGG